MKELRMRNLSIKVCGNTWLVPLLRTAAVDKLLIRDKANNLSQEGSRNGYKYIKGVLMGLVPV